MSRELRVLVCGGRKYDDRERVNSVLRGIQPTTLIEGGARGADYLAAEWAYANGCATVRFPADWDRHGRSAGVMRNQQMITEGKPDLVVAFPGQRGTADMVDRARRAGIPVTVVGQ